MVSRFSQTSSLTRLLKEMSINTPLSVLKNKLFPEYSYFLYWVKKYLICNSKTEWNPPVPYGDPFLQKQKQQKQEKGPFLDFSLYGTRKSLVQVIIIPYNTSLARWLVNAYWCIISFVKSGVWMDINSTGTIVTLIVWHWLIMDGQEFWESDNVLRCIAVNTW